MVVAAILCFLLVNLRIITARPDLHHNRRILAITWTCNNNLGNPVTCDYQNYCEPGFGCKLCSGVTSNCKVCHWNSIANAPKCLKCLVGYLLNESDSTCVPTCPDGTYRDDYICKPCHVFCANCYGPAPSHCSRAPYACIPGAIVEPWSQACNCAFPNNYYDPSLKQCRPASASMDYCKEFWAEGTLCYSCYPNAYWLSPGYCVAVGPPGPGYYWVSATVKLPCSAPCLTCFNATACDTCANGYVKSEFNPFECVPTSPPCALQYCAACADALVCQSCNYQALGQVVTRTGDLKQCALLMNSCPVGYYFSTSDNVCKPCSSGCWDCTEASPSICTSCSTELTLDNGACVDPNFSITPMNPPTCSISFCQECYSSTICMTCVSGYNLGPSNLTCIQCSGATWYDASATGCKNCMINCDACSDVKSCIKCTPGYTYDPVNSRCQAFIDTSNPSKLEPYSTLLIKEIEADSSTDLGFQVVIPELSMKPLYIKTRILREMHSKLAVSIQFTSKLTGLAKKPTIQIRKQSFQSGLEFQLNVEVGHLSDSLYLVNIRTEALSLETEAFLMRFNITSADLFFVNPFPAESADLLETVSTTMSTLQTTTEPNRARAEVINTGFLAIDQTGIYFRVTKILQIVNKLYFININYGKRLEAFLKRSADNSKARRFDPSSFESRYRSKLSEFEVPLSIFDTAANWKVFTYWASSAARAGIAALSLLPKVGNRKWMRLAINLISKVHLIVFNLVFVDFLWLAPRTLFHSRDLDGWHHLSTWLTLILIQGDFWKLLTLVWDSRVWRTLYQLNSFPRRSQSEYTNQPQTKQINYKKTYFEIDSDVHLLEQLTFLYNTAGLASPPAIVRQLALSVYSRIAGFQLICGSTQTIGTFGLTFFMALESAHLLATIYAYLKYKYLKNIICLLMELVESIFLIGFGSVVLIIKHRRSFDKSLDLQDLAIWIVLLSAFCQIGAYLCFVVLLIVRHFINKKQHVSVIASTVTTLRGSERSRDLLEIINRANSKTEKDPSKILPRSARNKANRLTNSSRVIITVSKHQGPYRPSAPTAAVHPHRSPRPVDN